MESVFRRLGSPSRRRAFVEAELLNGLSHQIRILRQQRGWTQAQLAKRLGTTQAAVSRLEDPSYGRWSTRTLLDLSAAFDVGLLVRFIPFSRMVMATERVAADAFEAAPYEEEAALVTTQSSADSTSTLANNPAPSLIYCTNAAEFGSSGSAHQWLRPAPLSSSSSPVASRRAPDQAVIEYDHGQHTQ